MNKRRIDEMIPSAYEAIANDLAVDGKIDKAYRGAISSFGAAIIMGSILSAAAYYNETDTSDKKNPGEIVDKNKVSVVLLNTLKKSEFGAGITENTLYEYVTRCCREGEGSRIKCKELICDTAVAVKLALNLFTLT